MQHFTIHSASDNDIVDDVANFVVESTTWISANILVSEIDDDRWWELSSTEVLVGESIIGSVGLRLREAPTGTVTVTALLRSGGDADLSLSGPTALVFDNTNWNVFQAITLAARDDVDVLSGSAMLELSRESTDFRMAEIEVRERDDDAVILALPVVIDQNANITFGSGGMPQLSVNEGSQTSYGIRLAGRPSASVTVTTTVSGDPDLTITQGASLVFDANNWDQPQIVTVTASQDIDLLIGSANLVSSASGWRSAEVLALEMDDDRRIVDGGANLTSDPWQIPEGASASRTITLSGAPELAVKIKLRLIDADSDLAIVLPNEFTFDASNWNLPRTITVSAAEDGDSASGLGTIELYVEDGSWPSLLINLAEQDNDPAAIVVNSPSTPLTTSESGNQVSFSVKLATRPTNTVTVPIVPNDYTEVLISASVLTFGPDDWDTAQTVTVTGLDDAVDDDDRSITIAIGPTSGSALEYQGKIATSLTVIKHR